jgi:hypothetical protein
MPRPRVDDALTHFGRVREILLHHSGGRADTNVLTEFRALTFAASQAADDSECAGMMRSADRYALDLFSAAHENWATDQLSGTDFLRLQIFKLLDAFSDRLVHLHAVGHGIRRNHPSP